MEKSSFVQDCKDYFDKLGYFKQSPTGEAGGNTLLDLSIYFLIKKRFHGYSLSDGIRFTNIYDLSKRRRGVLNRSIYKEDDQQRHDDYVGEFASGSFLDEGVVEEMYQAGGPFFYYNNTGSLRIKDIWDSWFMRLPGLIAHFKLCSDRDLNLLDQVLWFIDIISTSYKDSNRTSGRILDFCKIEVYKTSDRQYSICDWAVKIRERKIRKRYPRLMGQIFHIYYDRGNMNPKNNYVHPFAKWMDGKI